MQGQGGCGVFGHDDGEFRLAIGAHGFQRVIAGGDFRVPMACDLDASLGFAFHGGQELFVDEASPHVAERLVVAVTQGGLCGSRKHDRDQCQREQQGGQASSRRAGAVRINHRHVFSPDTFSRTSP